MGRQDFRLVRNVKVSRILLDVENARIRAGQDQADCIARILRKEDQLFALMEDIASNGLSTVPILVSPGPRRGTWIVKDGNRRLTSLKLLNDPDLCPDARLRTRVKSLVRRHGSTISPTVDVLASDDEEAIIREVVSRHSGTQGGVGQLDWSAYLRTIYLLHHGHPADYKRPAQYVFWAEESGILVEDEFPITTMQRFFTVENLKELGFKVENDELVPIVPPATAKAMAQRVITDFQRGGSKGGKSVDDVRTPELARRYIDEVRNAAGLSPGGGGSASPIPSQAPLAGGHRGASKPPPASTAAPGVPPNNAGGPTAAPQPAPKGTSASPTPRRSPGDRVKVLGMKPDLAVPSTEAKACTIVTELRKLNVKDTPLAAAMLLRHLIELSDSYYRRKHHLGDKSHLHKNVLASANHLLSHGGIDQSVFDSVNRLAQSGGTDILHIENLQKIMHRDTHHPNFQVVNGLWDNIAPFVRACWTK